MDLRIPCDSACGGRLKVEASSLGSVGWEVFRMSDLVQALKP